MGLEHRQDKAERKRSKNSCSTGPKLRRAQDGNTDAWRDQLHERQISEDADSYYMQKKKKKGGDLRFVDDTVRHLQKTSAEGQVIN